MYHGGQGGIESVWLGCRDKTKTPAVSYCFSSILKFTGILLFQPSEDIQPVVAVAGGVL